MCALATVLQSKGVAGAIALVVAVVVAAAVVVDDDDDVERQPEKSKRWDHRTGALALLRRHRCHSDDHRHCHSNQRGHPQCPRGCRRRRQCHCGCGCGYCGGETEVESGETAWRKRLMKKSDIDWKGENEKDEDEDDEEEARVLRRTTGGDISTGRSVVNRWWFLWL